MLEFFVCALRFRLARSTERSNWFEHMTMSPRSPPSTQNTLRLRGYASQSRAEWRKLCLPPKAPDEILSPREMEVLQLLARGFRNREIAKALVISDSTTKVHVRHILEKMGVRTRTEAVARLGLFQ